MLGTQFASGQVLQGPKNMLNVGIVDNDLGAPENGYVFYSL